MGRGARRRRARRRPVGFGRTGADPGDQGRRDRGGPADAAGARQLDIIPLPPKAFQGKIDVDEQGRLQHIEWKDLPIRDVRLSRAPVERLWRTQLPRKRPEEVDAKTWIVAGKIWELWSKGHRWPSQEVWRDKVREALGWDPKHLSVLTVRTAFDWLQKENYVDGPMDIGELAETAAEEECRTRVQPNKDATEKRQRKLPAKRPKGMGAKTWRVTAVAFDLRRGDYRRAKQEDLLAEVNKGIAPEKASLATLKIALAYLKKNRLIDR